MRIGTWNVEYAYEKRLPALNGMLNANSADVLVLTETHDALTPSGLTHAAHSLPRPKEWSGIREGSRWVSIWSRFPLIAHVDLPEADKERTVAALFDAGDAGRLLVYGTVLPWKGDRGVFDWSEHHRVIEQQCAEWLSLRHAYPNISMCVAGDFNTDMGTGGYYGTRKGIEALRAGLATAGLYCATGPDVFPTGRLPYPPIDHVALPIEWRNQTSIVASWPADKQHTSDHSGLIIGVSTEVQPYAPNAAEIVKRVTDAAFEKPLVTNVHRSMLVEAIVAAAIEPEWKWCAADYASCDFLHSSGARLEVKQSAAKQTWNANSDRESKPSFDIRARTGEYVDGVQWQAKVARNADIYVLALHPLVDAATDHRDPRQWKFYVVLESILPDQKTISLRGVAALCEPVGFGDLRQRVTEALSAFQAAT